MIGHSADNSKMSIRNEIKKDLWRIWGTANHPAEWDGFVFGGGRCSQRFWEYLFVIDNLPENLSEKSIILDIGSGITKFLPILLRRHCRCLSFDPFIAKDHEDDILDSFRRESLPLLDEYAKEIEAVTCVSVLEHIPDQEKFIATLDLVKSPVIITFEFGSNPPAFEYQLTMQRIYSFTKEIKNHYVSRIEESPVLADNSIGHWRPLGMVFLPL